MKKTIYISIFASIAFWIFQSCNSNVIESPVFNLLSEDHTKVDFQNTIQETDSFNMYTFMNIYTGGGVAIGDVNNDGLEDLFFSGNMVSSKLYLNKGNLEFEDVTKNAGIETERWCTGVSMVDINADGWLDIYLSVSGVKNTSNLLFENQKDGTFKEKAKFYGLDDTRQVMHSSFFDFDNDGDLDVYMIVNPVNYSLANVNNIRPRQLNGESESTDRLYRNDLNNLSDSKFVDVSKESGILAEGFSLGLATCDINGDGWQDIYVSNDFLTNDILYINNQDGTFSDQANTMLAHTSFAGMGNDVSDFNNDGLPDIIVADMLPEDNERRQLIIPSSSYDKFEMTQKMDYDPQFTRNTLQLNNGNGRFSEIGQLAGIDKTDWSWSSLFADFDNDGDKDLFVTNGFLRDVGNLDYISYQRKNNASPFGKKEANHKKRLQAIIDLGAAKIQNYVFENNGNLTFDKKNTAWGISQKTCSNGAAFADLDNDGDLEMVINNVNDRAFIYENKTNENHQNHFLKIKLVGGKNNPNGVGAKVFLETIEGIQFQQKNIFRGYESSVSQDIHFGLGKLDKIISIKIIWPNGNFEKMENISADQTISFFSKNASKKIENTPTKNNNIFTKIKTSRGLNFIHQENEFVDFKVQPLLPHKHSENGPGIAVGDVNGDGLEDCYIGGSGSYSGQLFLQTSNGNFEKGQQDFESSFEDMGCLFFDADSDGDLDLYIVSGGSSFPINSKMYQDRIYENDGLGNFTRSKNALPKMFSSGSTVSAADFDKDGDLDLFVGGRIESGAYPMPAQSYLLKNDSKKNNITFTDVSKKYLPANGKFGLVTSSIWTDFNNDGWIDLMVVGEWMPIHFLKNENGKLNPKPITLEHSNGWWNSLVAGDFDKDGDTDYVIGNLGLNTRFKASPEKPVCIYAKDFDKNGRIDPVICQYIEEENFIAHPRDLLIQQINAMRVRFRTYSNYGKTPFRKSFTEEELEGALLLKSEHFESSYLENLGDGNFKIRDLPVLAQTAPVFGMQVDDIDKDGNLDVLLVGNSFSTEVAIGSYDAFEGLLLAGDGKGNFISQKSSETGFNTSGDGKGLVKLQTRNETLYLVSQNKGPLEAFSKTIIEEQKIDILPNEVFALLKTKNGQIRKQEFYFGNSYLSQSSNYLMIDNTIIEVEIYNTSGKKRMLNFSKKDSTKNEL